MYRDLSGGIGESANQYRRRPCIPSDGWNVHLTYSIANDALF
jgi:hypothetical protein